MFRGEKVWAIEGVGFGEGPQQEVWGQCPRKKITLTTNICIEKEFITVRSKQTTQQQKFKSVDQFYEDPYCQFTICYSVSHHRLNGSSSLVLTATCLSYGRLCDFIFFPNRPGGHTPRPILTQNGSNDVGSRKDVPFGVKIANF